MHNIPIFCINLARAEKRRERIRKDWCNQYGFDIQFFEAFDRRNLPENPILIANQSECMKRLGRELSPGEIACATSHYLLCKKILDEGYSEAIIMEDDVYPFPRGFHSAEEFYQRINTAKAAFTGLKALILHNYDNHRNDKSKIKTKRIVKRILKNSVKRLIGLNVKNEPYHKIITSLNDCHLLAVPPWGARMIWYNRAGFELMTEYLASLYVPADHIYEIAFTPQRSIALLDPPIAEHYADDTFIDGSYQKTVRKYMP